MQTETLDWSRFGYRDSRIRPIYRAARDLGAGQYESDGTSKITVGKPDRLLERLRECHSEGGN